MENRESPSGWSWAASGTPGFLEIPGFLESIPRSAHPARPSPGSLRDLPRLQVSLSRCSHWRHPVDFTAPVSRELCRRLGIRFRRGGFYFLLG